MMLLAALAEWKNHRSDTPGGTLDLAGYCLRREGELKPG